MWLLGASDMSVREHLLCLVVAFLWDRWAGEPAAKFHPVVWIGRVIGVLSRLAGRGTPARELVQGLGIALVVPWSCWWGTNLVLNGLAETPWLRILVSIWLLKSTFALAALVKAAQVVQQALEAEDVIGARVGLRSLCSRDASNLSEAELAAGAVESVAENASDSVVAPLLFYALFGLPGALAYRAANTADAMIGYRGDYEYLGKAAARLDDLLNLIPARITALLLLLCRDDPRPRRPARVADPASGRRQDREPERGPTDGRHGGPAGVRLEKPGAMPWAIRCCPSMPARSGARCACCGPWA